MGKLINFTPVSSSRPLGSVLSAVLLLHFIAERSTVNKIVQLSFSSW